jgi:hypothetical protein
VTKSRRSVRRGPVVLNDNATLPEVSRPDGPAFVSPPPGPMPGRLLVLLSRLHRSETAQAAEPDPKAGLDAAGLGPQA